MARKSTRTGRITLCALGLAATIPLLAVTAASGGATSSGAFFVEARNFAEPQIYDIAGLAGAPKSAPSPGSGTTISPAPSGGSSTVPDPGAVTVADYSCGPLSFKLTQAMVDFARANQDQQAAGNTAGLQTSSDGWQGLYSLNPADKKLYPGLLASGAKSPQTFLTTGMTSPLNSALDTERPQNVKVRATFYDSKCDILDLRKAPAVGQTYSYGSNEGSERVYEGRYLQEEGKLTAIRVSKDRDGEVTVDRRPGAVSYQPNLSTRYPFILTKHADGSMLIKAVLPTTTDGYNYAEIIQNTDGSGSLEYSYYGGTAAEYSLSLMPPDRRTGPDSLSWNAQGELTALAGGTGARSKTIYLNERGTPYTVADYNAATGQGWNGSYLKPSDFDTSTPFAPTTIGAIR